MKDEKPVVYVVDDDPSVLKSLERLLRSAGFDVRTSSSAPEFLDSRQSDEPGCLVLDVQMPELDGLELQERLREKGITLPVIFITGHGTVPISVRAMKGGAIDFLQKPFLDKELLSVVSAAIDADRETRSKQRKLHSLRERLDTLTPREYQVFGLVVTGMLNKQIAYDLGTAEKTIKVHRARVMEKLGAQSLADLVRFAETLCIRPQQVSSSALD